ncbi:filamentous hemagglutinin N-terminal domain-containing protein [Halomicronema sp. CCY15110]|uniref:two-partner secretion domain-containing protein n=1 Tax=Halomicronema sp. CCY15110 TaxID=2767773 RepID=UPI00194FB488|nr:filamentous hemagglutinin N-terminal domain-containing protein [Halomicronema sp. CCY15110]
MSIYLPRLAPCVVASQAITATASILALGATAPAALAQLTPDATLGNENSVINNGAIVGGEVTDLIEGGATRGGNLFHSFLEFNIADGQRVFFANPLGIENILSRVTGGDPSNIFGTLGVNGPANLFFLNPNGIVFGPDAALDVGGSFAATTASGVRFGEIGTFSATDPELPSEVLTIAPSAFFFNQIEPAAITNESRARRSGLDPSGQFAPFGLRVPDGESLLLVGGNVNIAGGGLAAFGGNIDIGGLATADSIGLERENGRLNLQFPESANLANVLLTNDAGLIVTKDAAGTVAITARNLRLSEGSSIQAGVLGGLISVEDIPGSINLVATENLIIEENSEVSNDVSINALGNSGNLTLSAQNLSIRDGSDLSVSTRGRGDAGKIIIHVQDTMVLSNGENNDSFIFNNVLRGGEGDTGGIEIYTGSLEILDGAQMQSGVFNGGQGNSGDIVIFSNSDVIVDGTEDVDDLNASSSAIFTGITRGGIGNGGDFKITAQNVNVTNRAQLISQTAGVGNAGSIIVRAQNNIFLLNSIIISEVVERAGNGNGGNIILEAEVVELINGSSLLADSENQGDAGNISITASERVILRGRGPGANNPDTIVPSQISSTIESDAIGEGGDISITVGQLSINDGFISSSTFGEGNAGNVTVAVDSLDASNGSQILAFASGVGNAGLVSIDAQGSVVFQGRDQFNRPSGVFSGVNEGANGDSQGIEIEAGALSILERAQLVSSTEGNGNAGDISIKVQGDVSLNNSIILTEVTEDVGNGRGGNIFIRANTLDLVNGSSLLADTENIGDAGSIFIDIVESIRLSGRGPGANNPETILPSQITATVEEQAVGNGGDIDISAGFLTLTDSAFVRTSTFGQGPAGSMNIRVGSLSASGGAEIATLTKSSDPAGDLTITAANEVLLSGQADSGPTEVTSASRGGAQGDGGDTFITSPLIRITDGARLSAVSEGIGAAGSVNLGITRLEVFDGSIETNAAQSEGGDIRVNDFGGEPSGIVILRGDGDITTDSFGNGGNITLNSIVVAFDDSDILARSEDARGGNITLGPLFSETLPIGAVSPVEGNNRVDISADGRIASGNISTPDVSAVENSLNELSGDLVDTAALTAGSCIARSDDAEGSFVVTGGEGLPQRPGGDNISVYPTGTVQTVPETAAANTLQEPQSVYRLADGRLVLSHECE